MHVRASVVTDEDQNNANPFFLVTQYDGRKSSKQCCIVACKPFATACLWAFSGAVGKYSMSSSVDQPIAKVNDAISLTVYVEGNGDLEPS